jgi:hypothetical protein
MVYIIAIPLYYQTSSYAFPPPSDHPTTTARYIALRSTSDPILQDRDYAIAKDAVAWGWKVYDTDPSEPKMRDWWERYEATTRKNTCTWDDDLWRIWQREHCVRILEKNAELKGKGEGSGGVSAMQSALGKLKKVGRKVKRSVARREAVEYELRQVEGRKREKRRQAAKTEWTNANKDAEKSTLSLSWSFTERLERFDIDKRKECEVDVGTADDTTVRSAALFEMSKPMVLTRHSWLYRG